MALTRPRKSHEPVNKPPKELFLLVKGVKFEGQYLAEVSLPTPEDVRRLRKTAGLTQKELAKRAEVSQSLVARIEGGSVDPRLSTIKKILMAISITKEQKAAKDIMHKPVISVEASSPIRKAVDLMRKFNISQMPVLKDGKVVGSVQETTLLRRILQSSRPENVFNEPIEAIMEERFPTIGASAGITEIMHLLARGAPALVVTDRDKPVGIITKIDVLQTST